MTDDTYMKPYPKVPSPFKRFTEGPRKNQFDYDRWTSPAFSLLREAPWYFTEKVDGTNIRVGWDGYRVHFAGRTDKAQLQPDLLEALHGQFKEELFEQQFGEQPVTLYGEGYGAGIQKGGGNYRQDKGFVLFDVRVGRWWLERDDVKDVGNSLGVLYVPGFTASLNEGMQTVTDGLISAWGDFRAEGLVGVVKGGLLHRDGSRIQVKVKSEDFYGG